MSSANKMSIGMITYVYSYPSEASGGDLMRPRFLRTGTFERACRLFAVALCLLPLAAANVAAQAETNASIIGLLTDPSGAVLPGVTVTAASPALQVRQMTTVTDERGEYRLTSLPIGTYDVTYSLDGFRMVNREGLRLTLNFTARIDIVMELGALSETVTVSGASPVVDVASTRPTTALTRETLELVPTSRNGLQAILAQVPGVRTNLDVGGNTTGAPPIFRVFGQNAEPWPIIEGIFVASPKGGAQSGVYYDFAAVEEVQVRTMGNDAEVPVRGVQLTAIMRSGGNTFDGAVWWSYTNNDLDDDNIDARLASQGIRRGNPIVTRWDLSGDLGGRIVRDKVWFFAASRSRKNVNEVLDCVKPDGSPCVVDQTQKFNTGKLLYQFTRSNKLVGFYQWNTKIVYGGASQFVPWESGTRQEQPGNAAKIGWESTIGNSAVANLQVGYWDWGLGAGSWTGRSPGQVSTFDIRTLRRTGQSETFGLPAHPGEYRYQTRGYLSWYRPDWLHGNHDFKAGFDVFPTTSKWVFDDRGDAGNYGLRFNNGVPFQIATYNSPVTPITKVTYTGLYIRDSWTVGRRLTLNLGVRYAHDNLYVPEQSRAAGTFAPAATFPEVRFNTWNTLAPRLHAAYDISGDGKTVVKGGWGRFVHMRGTDEGDPANPNARAVTTYTWHDLNGNRQYDPGEVNLDLNGPDFIRRGGGNQGTLEGNAIQDPNEKPPTVDEVSVSIEREIMANFGVRVSGIYSREFNVQRLLNTRRPYESYNIPITNPDPGPDGRVRTADDPGTTITYYEYPSSLRGLAFQVTSLVNDPRATRSWKSLEIAASKRLSNRWQAMASYSATKINVPFVTNVGGGNDFPVNTLDPNSEIFAADNTWEWETKASGVYQLPWGLLGSANYELRSGLKWARTALFTGGSQIPSIVLRVEPIGSRRLPNLHLLDFRGEKTVRLASQTVTVRLDVFNALNINTVTAVTQQSGASFGRPTAIVPGRNVQVGFTYSF